jgi:hypothetical protein
MSTFIIDDHMNHDTALSDGTASLVADQLLGSFPATRSPQSYLSIR